MITIKEENVVFNERQGLIVWVKSLRNIKNLRKYGNMHYVSRKMKYAVIYCDKSEAETTTEKLLELGFVKSVEPSLKNTLNIVPGGKVVERETFDDFKII